MEGKFKVGDKVDYVNDFGVLFPGHTVTKLDVQENEIRYFIDSDCYWVSKREKNLFLPGTYNAENLDIELNNGMVAKFSHYDDWYNLIYVVELSDKSTQNAVLLDGKTLYSITDYDEPVSPLAHNLQPKN